MELYQLKYFCAAAETENFQRAAKMVHTTPPSITKAVASLEQELGMALFTRHGKSVRLTKQGRVYAERMRSALAAMDRAHLDLVGDGLRGPLNLVVAGREVLLSEFALARNWGIRPESRSWNFEFIDVDGKKALELVESGVADVALTVQKPAHLEFRKISKHFSSQIFCSPKHPLAAEAKRGVIPLESVMKHAFAAPGSKIFDRVAETTSFDGWRDDLYPRRIQVLSQSLGIILEAVFRYRLLAFLPESIGHSRGLVRVNVSGHKCARDWDVFVVWRHKPISPLVEYLFVECLPGK